MDRPDCNAILLALTEDALGPEISSTVERIAEHLGEGPRLLRTVAHSPAALEVLVGHAAATARMRLSRRTRAAIGLRVAELNRSQYCLAAQAAAGEELGLDADTIRRFRLGLSDDQQEQALLALATKLVVDRGHHTRCALEAVRQACVPDEKIVEVAALVGLHTFTNYLSSLAGTQSDFSELDELSAPNPTLRPDHQLTQEPKLR